MVQRQSWEMCGPGLESVSHACSRPYQLRSVCSEQMGMLKDLLHILTTIVQEVLILL